MPIIIVCEECGHEMKRKGCTGVTNGSFIGTYEKRNVELEYHVLYQCPECKNIEVLVNK